MMSVIDKIEENVNLPVALQVVGVAVFAITVWKGVHGGWPTFGLIASTGMLYVGKHFQRIYSPTPSK